MISPTGFVHITPYFEFPSYSQQKSPEENLQDLEGCQVGLEPTTFGTTIRHSNQLNYWHHVYLGMQR